MHRRILALDVGDRTVGLAVSDALGYTAQPLKTLRYKTPVERKSVFIELAKILAEMNIGTLLIGLPLNMNGSEGPQVVKVRVFITALQKFLTKSRTDPATFAWLFWDERLSTAGAERRLIEADVSRSKRKTVIDTMAAVFILQGFLESQIDYDSQDDR